MLHAMKTYQNALGEKGQVLNGVEEMLEHTSKLVEKGQVLKGVEEMHETS